MNSTTDTLASLTIAQRTTAFAVTTQYMENYGDRHEPHWKGKGGFDYIVVGAPDADAATKAAEAQMLNHEYSQEWAIATETYAEWEAKLPTDAEYRDFLKERARVIHYTP